MKLIYAFTIALFCLSGSLCAGGSVPMWECFSLLDEHTQSRLRGFEQSFLDYYQYPQEYKNASKSQRRMFESKWIKDINGRNQNADYAAAYLGMVRSQAAVESLEKILSDPPRNGKLKSACTRSLGQIKQKSSIPVLISLLDDINANTRVYARVSLAEITGVFLGKDKEKWEAWQGGKPPQLCTSTECKTDQLGPNISELRKSSSRDKLDFCLPDVHGRIVDSQDYTNMLVLIMSGSCWCGGCQQDAEPLRNIATEYAGRGLATIRTVAGDNELAALDFQKHYRLPFVQLLDTNRSFEKRYNSDGWTFLMLADRKGDIVYKVNSPHEEDWLELRRILNEKLLSSVPTKAIIRDDTTYMPATLHRSEEIENQNVCERFPSVACGPEGKVYVVFTSNRNDSSDIYLRVFDGSEWSKDLPIATTDADEYDGTVLVDKEGQIWVCWTSNAIGKNYDIFAISFTNPLQIGTPTRLTNSNDDAMHSRMACDNKGRVWVTYYKWHKMGSYSRDKEVYAQRHENGKWSDEVLVSPTDVPQYEDHSDPTIIGYGNGAVVAWSWDFHPPNKGYSNQAETPTIFMRPIFDNMNLGEISCISGKNIDVMPVLAVSKSRKIWCAWDSLGRGQQKNLCISSVYPRRNNPISRILSLGNPVANVCTPSLAVGPAGQLTLLWSETKDGSVWSLKRVDLGADNHWSAPTVVESSGNLRFCSAAYDLQGQLWVSSSAQTKQGREIVTQKLSKNEIQPHVDRPKSGETSINTQAINKLHQAIDEKYSYRDFRDIDWNEMYEKYDPMMQRANTPRKFAEVTSRILTKTKDMHVWVKVEGESIGGFKRKVRRNYNTEFLKREVPGWKDLSEHVSMGQFPDNIGYILIKSWRKDENQVLKPALKAIKNLSNTQSLIIDVRPNGGGSEPFAKEVAECFIDHPVVYAKHVYRKTNSAEGWGEIQKRIIEPAKDQFQYRGKVAVLMGQVNMSSCEAFLLMMKQVQNCKLIGEGSYGSSGNPKPHDLGNGVTVWLPSWKALRPDETCFEGQGIKPDIRVKVSEKQLKGKDPVLETALKYLRNSS